MVELFSNFTSTLVIVGVILALGIIFEKQLIALEDKFDAYVATLRKSNKSKAEISGKKTSAYVPVKKRNGREDFAA